MMAQVKRRLLLSLILIVLSISPALSQSLFDAAWQGELEIVESAIQKAPEKVNALNEYGYSAIMMAVIWGRKNQEAVIDLLLKKGADINRKTAGGKTALHFAAEYADSAMVQILLNRSADIYIKDNSGREPYYYAVFEKKSPSIDLLYKPDMRIPGGEDGVRLLHSAASSGHQYLVDRFLENRVDISVKRKDGGSLLHGASEGNLPALIEKLLNKGFDINLKNIYHLTPLHTAVEHGSRAVVKSLLKHGVDRNAVDNLGQTPYHMALSAGEDDLAGLLVSSGADKTPYKYHVSGPYFNQTPPGMEPEIFAPGIISTQRGFEFAGVFTPDGQHYFFTQRGLGSGQRIRHMRMEDGSWTEPAFTPFGFDCFEFEPGISPDGKHLYYGSRRPLPGKEEMNPGADIWLTHRTENGWGEPEYVGSDMMYVTVTGTGTIYYTGKAANSPMRGIVKKVLRNGQFEDPVDLGENINFMPGTAHPFIAPDESYLIFDAQPHGPEAGPDLFVSFRRDNGEWTRAVSMGDVFNAGREMCASVSFDGKYLFFARDGDIYWADAVIIDILRKDVLKER